MMRVYIYMCKHHRLERLQRKLCIWVSLGYALWTLRLQLIIFINQVDRSHQLLYCSGISLSISSINDVDGFGSTYAGLLTRVWRVDARRWYHPCWADPHQFCVFLYLPACFSLWLVKARLVYWCKEIKHTKGSPPNATSNTSPNSLWTTNKISIFLFWLLQPLARWPAM